jgi:CO/xanthine dehydrogenase Mo-binding subunit
VSGETRYTADVLLPGTLWGKALRSPYSHARIFHIDTSRAEKTPGVRAVLTGEDVRGILYGRRYRDLRVLAHDRVLYMGERVAAVAAEEREAAQEALQLINVEYEEIPGVFDPVEALQEGAPLIHPDVNSYPGLPKRLDPLSNAYYRDVIEKGDLEQGFAQSDVIVENTFTVSRVHPAFLETHCCLVWIDEQDKIQVWSSSKAPHVVKRTLSDALDIPRERIRVNPVAIGGDFGGKGGALDEPLCYLLALRSRHPVKMVMEYQEEFTAGAPRHAAIIKMKTGVKRNGTLVAHQMDAYFDSGAYGGLRPGASFTGATHAGGCYRIPHARITVMRVYTNNIPGGQMRAPSEPQGFFAAESQIDCVARAVGMDPLEFRLKNLIEPGEPTVTGSYYEEVRAIETLHAAAKAAKYNSPKKENAGRGMAMGFRSPGGGATSVTVTLNPDGTVALETPMLEQGTWTYTSLRQIVAEELQLNPENIKIKVLDTDSSPFDSGIGGSRGTRIASRAAFQAARDVKEELFGLAAKMLGWSKEEMMLDGKEIIRKGTRQRQRWGTLLSRAGHSVSRRAINRDEEHAHVTSFTAQVAEVSVDRETGQVILERFTTSHDTGTILNPIGHQGQIEGGVVQGIGYGLMEEVRVEDGRVITSHFGDYKIPTIKDVPDLRTVILEGENGVGPYNIKGIGENPISPVAPAIANAIEDATGVRIRDLPLTAEKVYEALKAMKK